MYFCKYLDCQATQITLLEAPVFTYVGKHVVGLTTSFECGNSSKSLSLTRADTSEQSFSISDTNGFTRGSSKALSVSLEAGPSFVSNIKHLKF